VVWAGARSGLGSFYTFDPRKDPGSAMQKLCDADNVYSITTAGRRIYFTQPRDHRAWQLAALEFPAVGNPRLVDYGELVDQNGRRPQRLGGIAADGEGRVYFVGDWFKLPGEKGSMRDGKERETVHRFGVAELPGLADVK
jgi:hypothetical protein